MKNIYLFAIASCLVFTNLIGIKQARADTFLDPNIEGEVHLTINQSPYIVGGDGLSVNNNARLTIGAGVIIRFPEYASFSVLDGGQLLIQGSNQDKVILKGDAGNIEGWQGLSIHSANVSIDSLEIENARKPIISDQSIVKINNLVLDGRKNIFSLSTQYGIRSTRDMITISSSSIFNFKTSGIYQQSGTSTLRQNIITHNGIGVLFKIYVPPVLVKADSLVKSLKSRVARIFLPLRAEAESTADPIITEQNIIMDNALNAKNDSDEIIISMKNNFWGSEMGPEGTITGNILTSPWLLVPPMPIMPIVTCCSNVLFIPGFEATRLHKQNNQLWEPNRNADVEKLYLNSAGESIDPYISIGGIIKKTNIGLGLFDQSIYDSFSGFMDGLVGDRIINKWKPYPYDWRLDLPISSTTEQVITDLALESMTGKVTLIGHSNGGLMAKKITEVLKNSGKGSS